MRNIPAKLLFGLCLSLVFAPAARANLEGTPTQNFNPTSSGMDFISVHSSETLKPGVANFGFFLNYAVNSLPYYGASVQNKLNFNDTLLSADLNFGLGILRNLEVGLSIPFLLAQSVSDVSVSHGSFGALGLSEFRVLSKYRLWNAATQGLAVVASMNFNRTTNEPYTGAGLGGGPTLNLQLAGTTLWKGIVWGANVGHRWRSPGEPIAGVPVQPLGNQLIASVAASHLLEKLDTKLIVELLSGLPTEDSGPDPARSHASLELLAGLKHDLSQNLSGHAGLGTQIVNGIASPDWRVYTGINWSLGPLFSKPENEKIVDSDSSSRLIIRSILFEFDSDVMTGDYDRALDVLFEEIKRLRDYREIIIEGHTDSRGSAEYNVALSEKRAQAIKRTLIEKYRMDPKTLTAVGFGAAMPIANNGNYQGRQANRRVEFKIVRRK
ncbi:MAG: OmpA family protein [Oligoflexia bacterium]|nr:OmpA family protein [Oligoflexia bacterium]